METKCMGYYKTVYRDCTKCKYYQPMTKAFFECARNFPPECCVHGDNNVKTNK